MALLASEPYMWMEDAFIHNTEVTVAGVTYARTLEYINSYSHTFENTGSAYTVRIEGSNNNIFDIENGILNPTPLVTVISTNSAGLIIVVSGSGVTQGDKDDIENQIFARIVEDGHSFEELIRIVVADSAGRIIEDALGNYTHRDLADLKDRITGSDEPNGGRSISSVDGT